MTENAHALLTPVDGGAAIRVIVHGAAGRMGQRICALLHDDARFALAGALDQRPLPAELQNTGSNAGAAEVIIDFSSEQGAMSAVQLAARSGAALLVGTTGLSSGATREIEAAASSIALMIAPNTSRGVAVLNRLVIEAARQLGDRYQIDLVEHHHRMKRDAPSGTALRLVAGLRDEAGVNLAAERVHSIRAGEIIGDHEVQFAGCGERLVLRHAAVTRDLFAAGALDAAAWLSGRPPGRYTIDECWNSLR